MTKTAELWKKEAQAGLEKVAVSHKSLSSGGMDRLTEYWNMLSPETKQTLINSIIGGTVGAGSMGIMGALSAPEGHGLSKGVNSAMMGSILGALTGGAGTAAYNALSSGRVLPGEVKDKRPFSESASDKVVGSMLHNPLFTAGTVGGGYFAAKGGHELLGNVGELENIMKNMTAGTKIPAYSKALHMASPSLLGLAALPAGMTMGYLADKYLKGDYE